MLCSRLVWGVGLVLGRSECIFSAFHPGIPRLACSNPLFVFRKGNPLSPLTTYSLAVNEVRLILTHLLFAFDFSIIDETDKNWLDQKGWFTWAKGPLVLGIKEVKR